MADAYIIEIEGRTAGIVTREHARESFTFYASDSAFYHLEGQRFATPAAATRVALSVLRQVKSRVPRATPAPELNV